MVVERISPEYIHKHYMVNKLLRHNAIKPINGLNWWINGERVASGKCLIIISILDLDKNVLRTSNLSSRFPGKTIERLSYCKQIKMLLVTIQCYKLNANCEEHVVHPKPESIVWYVTNWNGLAQKWCTRLSRQQHLIRILCLSTNIFWVHTTRHNTAQHTFHTQLRLIDQRKRAIWNEQLTKCNSNSIHWVVENAFPF